jgi:hypothetical protein
MELVQPSTYSGILRHPDDELVLRAIAWQFPQHHELFFDDAMLADISTSCETPSGTDDCQMFSVSQPPLHEVSLRADYLPFNTPFDDVHPEGDFKPQNFNRPFLSLTLPEWVHEKAMEDEVAGTFTCRSLASFASSPTSSTASSPVTSPVVPSVDVVTSRSRFFSGVSWADLAESEDEEPIEYAWSVPSAASTAASSPAAVCTASTPKVASSTPPVQQGFWQDDVCAGLPASADLSPIAASIASQDFFAVEVVQREFGWAQAGGIMATTSDCDDGQMIDANAATVAQCSGVRWTDLVESDLDPLDYQWSPVDDYHGSQVASAC